MHAGSDLFEAIRAGDAARVRKIVESEDGLVNAQNPQGQSAVLVACYMGQTEIRDLLVEKGANLGLHEAAAAGHLPRVKQCLDGKSELAKSYSPDGFPVVALAAAFGHENIVRYLCGKGAEVNAVSTNGTGYNALTGAVAGSHTSIVKWLAENEAEVNYRYGKGHSPLLEAAANGKLDIVKILLAHGADRHARTNEGRGALDFAEERGHKELAEYLRGLDKS
jgi:ankyrin repeat protein